MLGDARFGDAEELLGRGLTLVRRRGDRQGERWLIAQGLLAQMVLGRWDETLRSGEALRAQADDQWSFHALVLLPHILCARGDIDGMRALLEPLGRVRGWAELGHMAKSGRALIRRETGDPVGALPVALEASQAVIGGSLSHAALELAEAVECAFAAGAPERVAELLERIDALQPVQLIPLLDAEAMRARARLATSRQDPETAVQWFRRSIDLFRELGTPFFRARAQLEYAELLAEIGGETELIGSLAGESSAVFTEVGAQPWLHRAHALGSKVPA
jgi:tetratricopeptide (TPR) repeat protein